MGKACILSDAGSTGEFFHHNKYAYLYEPGTERELAKAILMMLEDGGVRGMLESNTYDFLKANSFLNHITIDTITKSSAKLIIKFSLE